MNSQITRTKNGVPRHAVVKAQEELVVLVCKDQAAVTERRPPVMT